MQLIRRIVGWGLAAMGAVAFATAIWPAVAGVVTGLLVTVLCTTAAALVVLGGRRVRAWRRELRAIPSPGVSTDSASTDRYATAGPSLAGVRPSA